jgi:hypothetical protein
MAASKSAHDSLRASLEQFVADLTDIVRASILDFAASGTARSGRARAPGRRRAKASTRKRGVKKKTQKKKTKARRKKR